MRGPGVGISVGVRESAILAEPAAGLPPEPMEIPLVTVDAFAEEPFAGNPAAVCLLPAPRPEDWMRKVAREMNLSETAFLLRREDGWGLRWFTPTVEVDLCGHATLASAHVLWEEGRLGVREKARFFTRSGLLTAEKRESWIELDFPADPEREVSPPPGLAAALGVEARYVGRGKFDLLVEVESESVLRDLRPDFGRIAAFPFRCVVVTAAASTPGFDYVCRFFAPASGVAEDPVTGSAQCTLGPFWSKRLGKRDLIGFQASERGGVVRVSVGEERARIAGKAVTVLQGTLVG